MKTAQADILIIGAGIAGAGLAAFLSAEAKVILLEAEMAPGYHTTGRSAAFYAETYGGRAIQPLTTASQDFFTAPPEGFAEGPLLGPRGALHIARADQLEALDILAAEFAQSGVALVPCDSAEAIAHAPGLRADRVARALYEPGCRDIDVAALHQGFLRKAKAQGMALFCNSLVQHIEYKDHLWQVQSKQGVFAAPILVNAAGAWADAVAAMAGVAPIGLQPLRRTVSVLDVAPPVPSTMPLVIDVAGCFYFKPDAGTVWLSPHDETPSPPCDARPEEEDVARILALFERETDWRITKPIRSWAGLRSFAPDRLPVYGFEPTAPGFFWCAGQGGFGIQTAPAASKMAAQWLLEGQSLWAETMGISPALYAIDRLRA